tara:strand:- start:299 stop:550 length:252 start_codon:yes stop_codon:yes gene_type:complete
MKLKIISLFIILLLFFLPANSNEIDCTEFKKLSAKYIECNAKKLKEKTNKKVDLGKEKFEKSGIKDKFKKFKNSKTLSDLIKN